MLELVNDIRESEGFETKPYIDVLVKKHPEQYGISKDDLEVIERHLDKLKLTFGIGLTYITEDESKKVVEMRVKNKAAKLADRKPVFLTLSNERQSVLLEMQFQLGTTGLCKFRKMWNYIEQGDFTMAAREGLDSQWYHQTPWRAEKLMKRLSEG